MSRVRDGRVSFTALPESAGSGAVGDGSRADGGLAAASRNRVLCGGRGWRFLEPTGNEGSKGSCQRVGVRSHEGGS